MTEEEIEDMSDERAAAILHTFRQLYPYKYAEAMVGLFKIVVDTLKIYYPDIYNKFYPNNEEPEAFWNGVVVKAFPREAEIVMGLAPTT